MKVCVVRVKSLWRSKSRKSDRWQDDQVSVMADTEAQAIKLCEQKVKSTDAHDRLVRMESTFECWCEPVAQKFLSARAA